MNDTLERKPRFRRWPLLGVMGALLLTATVGCYYYPEDFGYAPSGPARYHPSYSYGYGHAHYQKHKHPKYKHPKHPKYKHKKVKHHPHGY